MMKTNQFNITQKTKHFKTAEALEELGSMLKAGIPILKAIELLSKNKGILGNIAYDLQNGAPLSTACSYHPEHFDKLTCQFILLGERTGNLDTTLLHAADLLKQKHKIKKDILNALTYPAIVLSVALLMIVFMLLFVLPHFDMIFKNMNAELPLLTQVLMIISHACKLGMLPFIAITLILRKPLARHLVNYSKRHPPFSQLWLQCYQLHLIRTLAYCQRAGIDLQTALSVASDSSIDETYKNTVNHIKIDVSLGFALSTALSQHKLFSSKVIELIKLAETTGELDNILVKLTTDLEQKQQAVFSRLSKLVEPVIMIILGIFMGGIVISLYLPVFKMGDIF